MLLKAAKLFIGVLREYHSRFMPQVIKISTWNSQGSPQQLLVNFTSASSAIPSSVSSGQIFGVAAREPAEGVHQRKNLRKLIWANCFPRARTISTPIINGFILLQQDLILWGFGAYIELTYNFSSRARSCSPAKSLNSCITSFHDANFP